MYDDDGDDEDEDDDDDDDDDDGDSTTQPNNHSGSTLCAPAQQTLGRWCRTYNRVGRYVQYLCMCREHFRAGRRLS